MQHCYYCCHEIEGKVLGLPQNKSETGTYICYGQFCSFSCMKTYTLESNISYKNLIFSLISTMLYETTGSIKCAFAPRREQLKMFGGCLSIEDFRQKATIIPVQKLIPPLEFVTFIFDKHENFSIKHSDDDIKTNNHIANEPIKLQRPGTNTKKSQNTLERTMGLFMNT